MTEAQRAFLRPQICSWWLNRFWWPCRRETGTQLSSSWEAPSAPCKLSCWQENDTAKRMSGSPGLCLGMLKHRTASETGLTLCVSQLPGSRSPRSRRRFCLLSSGCWPRRRTRRRCSRQRLPRLSTRAGERIQRSENNNSISARLLYLETPTSPESSTQQYWRFWKSNIWKKCIQTGQKYL